MKQLLIKTGELVSTTDMKLAKQLGKIVNLEEITQGKKINYNVTESKTICFMLDGELYEVKNVPLQTVRA